MKNFNLEKSSLKEKLKLKQTTIGSWLTIPNQVIVELMGDAGFEWLVIDIEHSPIGIESVVNLIGHIQGNGMQALVRVSKNEEVTIKRVLDSGADGIIVPMVNNELDAVTAVNHAKYPPEGRRGVGLNRAQKYGTQFFEYKEWVKNEIVIIAQIEHIQGVNNLKEISSVKGLDGIIIGPYDLSSSMGYPGEYSKTIVTKALNKINQIIIGTNLSLGFHVIESNHEAIIEKLNKKFNFLAFSMDSLFLNAKIKHEMNELKKVIK